MHPCRSDDWYVYERIENKMMTKQLNNRYEFNSSIPSPKTFE